MRTPEAIEKKRAAMRDYKRDQYRRFLAPLPGEPSGASRTSHRWQAAQMTLSEAAQAMGITRQAAHQLERRALSKLRVALLPIYRELTGKT